MEVVKKIKQSSLLCRVCLIENPEKSESLFDVHASMSASEKVKRCTGVEMRETDELPGIICLQCSKELEAAHNFRIKCEYSNSLLKRFYINGVLKESIVENDEVSIDVPHEIVKDEVIVYCEPWIKSEEDEVVDDTIHNFSCEDPSSEITKASPKILENDLDDNDVNCNKSASFEKAPDLKMSNEKESRNKPFSCIICNKLLASKVSLERHTITVHSEEKNKRRQNMTGYGKNKRYHCTECSYSTPRRQALNYHSRTHTGERPYRCEVCDAKFSQPSALSGHAKLHSDMMYYTCPECGKQFKHRSSYELHKSVHSSELKYTCIICNKGLKTKKTLERHTNRHLNIRNYSCDACGARFVAITDLINHARKHSVVKKFECSICQFKTKIKHTLEKHMRQHGGEKSFKCDICQYTTFDRGNLTTHSRKHTREKNYSCPVCEVKMIYSTSVNRHMMTAHGLKFSFNDVIDRRIVK